MGSQSVHTSFISKKLLLFSMSIGIFAGVFLQLTLLYGTPSWLWSIVGSYNAPYTVGSFDTTGGGGNAGQITFIDTLNETLLGGSGVYMDTSNLPQTLSGYFFAETIGWVDMNNVELIPPEDMNVMTPWTLSGYIWSDNAGYIAMQAEDATYSGVSYVPGTQTFSGYAWGDTIGYIPFSVSTPGFKNKIKILGTTSKNKTYDTEYDIGSRQTATTSSSVIEQIRKNVALLTRNLPPGLINTTNISVAPYNNVLYYRLTNTAIPSISDIGSKMEDNDIQTLIVEGGDVYINDDVAKDSQVNRPRVVIAIKDASGSGGNIYIGDNVKNIYTSLIAEGSIYSGESSSNIYNDTTAELTTLPRNQLYIYGSVVARNTIGGSAQNPAACPYTEQNCTYTNSLKYDWNYFRTFDGDPSKASEKTGYDNYSIIIENDSRLSSDPPPGIAN